MAKPTSYSKKRVQKSQLMAGLGVAGFIGASALFGGLILKTQSMQSTVPVSVDADLAIRCTDKVHRSFTRELDPKLSPRWNFVKSKKNPFATSDGTAVLVARADQSDAHGGTFAQLSFVPKVRGDFVVQTSIKSLRKEGFDDVQDSFVDFNMKIAGQLFFMRVTRGANSYSVQTYANDGSQIGGMQTFPLDSNLMLRAARYNDEVLFMARTRKSAAFGEGVVLARLPFTAQGPLSDVNVKNYANVGGKKTGRQILALENFIIQCPSDLRSLTWFDDDTNLATTE